ncbi:MAG: class IIb bacteriocin, lactobin A/cerein 7B family [Brockia lithotrophica]|nr:class IIb bacteriocin, lactobin A/cerein 7B family [Brockia lithotrophica]
MEMVLDRLQFVELTDEETVDVEGGLAPAVWVGIVAFGVLAGAGFAAGFIDGYKDAKRGK